MTIIESFPFDKNNRQKIREYRFGTNWPVVYIIEGTNEAYVGQTTDAFLRTSSHLDNPERNSSV
jgi:hypothetical protein